MADDIGGVWRTVGGRRIFIKDGDDLETAMKKSGKFKKEYKYQKEYEEYKQKVKENPLPQKHYEKLKELELDDDEILFLKSNDVYVARGSKQYNSKEELKRIAKQNKEQNEEQKKFRQESQKQYQKNKEYEKEIKEKTIKNEGITEEQYEKELRAIKYREKKEQEIKLANDSLTKNQTGYTDENKSVRAVKAEMQGKFPKTEAAKMLGVSEKMIEKYAEVSEWHHSGGTLYNKVDYYDISKYIDIANNGIEYYSDDSEYKKYISNYKKMTGRK